ncbi:glutamate-1-semialdehyde 2,1-aminomutase [Rubritalea tangerina]|uniref:Glutamate-1-semialdehyde 2,1-aminomutase n=1 Tax=Rubritalea tangerina TaxID=430798 RepID=A0ABW4ZCP4_9BACT
MVGPLSQKLFAKAKTVIPGGVNSPVRAFKNVDGDPFFVRRAQGSRITDVDDKTYIDYIGTWGPAILGHSPIQLTQTIHEVAKDGVSFGAPCPWEIEMAQTIVDWVPSVQKVRMTNSGTEATMSAIRLARGFTGRDKVIKFDGCYHGHVDHLLVAAGSGALTHGEPDSAGVPKDFSNQTIVLPYNDFEAIQTVFDSIGDQVAAIILEPFPANAGFVFPREGYLEFLREITTKHGTVLIFDEVMTGFRVAKGGVQELVGVTPDLTCMGKVIGGGLPVGAFGGRADIMDCVAPIGPVYQAGTLSGNPLAMAAGLAQLKALEAADGYNQLEKTGARLEAGIRGLLKENGLDFTFHRVGSMFCLFFTGKEIWNVNDVNGADMEAFKRFFWALLDDGVYIAPSPYETGFISLAHSTGDIDDTLDAMSKAFKVI